MSGDHNEYHMQVEILKNDDHLNLAYELGYEAAKRDGVYLTSEEMYQMLAALEEAVYLLNPTEEDMQKKVGVYRVVTALEMLKEKNT